MKYRQKHKDNNSQQWSDWSELLQFSGTDSTFTFVCVATEHLGIATSPRKEYTLLRSWIGSSQIDGNTARIDSRHILIEITTEVGDSANSLQVLIDSMDPNYINVQAKSVAERAEQETYLKSTATESPSDSRSTGSGPFGLWMGMRKDEFEGSIEEIVPFKYRVSNVPRKHSRFEDYIVQIAPISGLAWIKGISGTVSTNPYGYELKTAFEDMEEKLSRIYGKSEKSDFLSYDSIWNEPRDWMQGLASGERYLFAKWNKETIRGNLPNELETVYLGASALDTYSGCIAIEYYFKNNEQATNEIDLMEDDAL
jgi:hypothetical protein